MSKRTLITILASIFITFAIDMFWLQVIAKDFYTNSYRLISNPSPNLLIILLFYTLYPICVFFLVIKPNFKLSKLLLNGALLGFAAYLTYDLTAGIIVKNFPINTIIPDVLWGTFLTADISIVVGIVYNLLQKPDKIRFGTTFSVLECNYLKIERFSTLEKILTNFKFEVIRLSAYWDEIESEQGIYNFDALDKELELCQKYNTRVILSVGRKTPRWPEYNEPKWFKDLLANAKDDFVRENLVEQYFYPFLNEVVNRYKNNHTIESWQIENEPFFEFGVKSYKVTKTSLEKEIQIVRNIDNTRILRCSDSAFMFNFGKLSKLFDNVGVNLYYTIANKRGYMKSRFPKIIYLVRQMFVGKMAYVSELQAEPWLHEKYQSDSLDNVSIDEMDKSASPEIILDNFIKTKNLGFDEIHFWGSEFWIYMQESRNDGRYIDKIKQIVG